MTQQFDIEQHLADMSDAELIEAVELVRNDLAEAAREAPNSERHQECFAGGGYLRYRSTEARPEAFNHSLGLSHDHHQRRSDQDSARRA